MEPVGTWGPARVAAWLRGLDAALQGYPFEAWGLGGPQLLALSAGALEALGMRQLGHQELLLEAVELLRDLDTGLASTSLRTLTEQLRELAQGTQSLVLRGSPGGAAPQPPPLTLLAHVVELLGAAKGLFSWLNRYLFSTLNDFSASRDIVVLCAQLVETLQEDCPVAERDSRILQICQHIVGICENIVGCSPPALLDRRAVLQRVGLLLPPTHQNSPPVSPDTPTLPPSLWESPPTSPDTPTLPADPLGSPPPLPTALLVSPLCPTLRRDPWPPPVPPHASPLSPQGLEITSTSSRLHFVSATPSEGLAAHGGLILPGDEIVQVNEQVVVGWTRDNLEKKLLEKAGEVTLVLKKIPLDPPDSPPSPRQQLPRAFSDAADSPGARSSECPGSPVSLSSSAAADLDSGPDSAPDPATEEEEGEDERHPRLRGADVGQLPGLPGCGQPPEGTQTKRSGDPAEPPAGLVPGPGPGGLRWLAPQEEGPRGLHGPEVEALLDEKAVGLINVATYDLESTREQKKKYVFQLSHQRYKPFVFAAETLADLSMWVSHLVTAKMKYTLAHQSVPDREEDCYSETEAEDPDDESPRHGCDSPRKRPPNAPEKAQLFAAGEPSSAASSPQGSPRPGSPMDSAGEDLECLMQCLKQGGVSLIGRQRFLTQEQCRKSFIRRNKNPHINEKVHTVRALQSTLKAKLEELHALEQLLSDAALTSEKFTRWKDEHQELYQELRECWAGQGGQDSDGGLGAEQGLPKEAAEP
ncbi:connector enhancer of kinase suppressor of ras 1 isoform X4 [Patagioenas fasciata]|uniref:connector enhancer of kinase suppressor of ras 1 isoform X4 n=1 Tax=Patagioenas fasciata TaxID=372321 RepID=UPI003A999D94